jgi:hypothetical protein
VANDCLGGAISQGDGQGMVSVYSFGATG